MAYLVDLNWTDYYLEFSDKDWGATLSLKGLVALVTPIFTQCIIQYGGGEPVGTLHYSGKHYSYRTWTSSKLNNCENLLPWENIVDRVPSIWLRTPSGSAVRAVIVGWFFNMYFSVVSNTHEEKRNRLTFPCVGDRCESGWR